MLKSTESMAVLTRRYDPDEWMPRSMALELDLQHQDLNREHEAREAYQVATQDEELRQLERRRSFARYVLVRVAAWKAGSELQRIDRRNGGHAKRVQSTLRPAIGSVRKPVVYAVARPGLQYGAAINLLEQNGQVWAYSTLANGAIEYQGVRPSLPLILRRDLEVFVTNERWRFQVWRPVPLLRNTEARATYGVSSAILSFSLGHSITAHLRAAYELKLVAEGQSMEHVIKIQYGVRI